MDLKTNKLGLLELSPADGLALICGIRAQRRASTTRQAKRRTTERRAVKTSVSNALDKMSLAELEKLLEASRG